MGALKVEHAKELEEEQRKAEREGVELREGLEGQLNQFEGTTSTTAVEEQAAPVAAEVTADSFKAALGSFLKQPKVDLVITWLNSSNATWRSTMKTFPGPDYGTRDATELYNPHGDSLVDTFVELKYALRSFETHGLMNYVRKIFIVHSDLYSPPNYLNPQNEQLQFVRHSDMWLESAKSAGLPNFNRNAIDSNVHRIKGLGDWYLTLMDDQFLIKPFKFVHFIGPEGLYECGKATDIVRRSTNDYDRGGVQTAAKLLAARYGDKSRLGPNHQPYLTWRPARELMERLWPDEHTSTAKSRYGRHTDMMMSCLYKNFIVDNKWGVTGVSKPCAPQDKWFAAIHTNGQGICPLCDGYKKDVTPAGVQNFHNGLEKITSGGQTWANLQGPGFDDAYRFRPDPAKREYSPKLTKLVRKWFEEQYPAHGRFES